MTSSPKEPKPTVLPEAALNADEDHIEVEGLKRGVDSNRASNAQSLADSLTGVAESDVLQYRLDQQAILSDFGLEALRDRTLGELQQMATEYCSRGMRTQFCKLLKYLPEEEKLLVCAGHGWRPGIVGTARVGADTDSPAGFAFHTGKPVISNHLDQEKRFRTPKMMAEHGVRRAVNVLVVASGEPWGVLEVDSPENGRFDVADIPFLQGFANLIGVTIERHRAEEALRETLEHQKLLVRESSHRTKNSLALVSSLLHLQAREATGEDIKAALGEAASRIQTISAAHDLLWRSDVEGSIDVGDLIGHLVLQLKDQAPGLEIRCEADELAIEADRAIAAGLFVTEVVTNVAKHAYSDGRGRVDLTCKNADGNRFELVIRDYGRGLPEGFQLEDPARQSLGVKMMRSLARQLRGQIVVTNDPGACFRIAAPLRVGNIAIGQPSSRRGA